MQICNSWTWRFCILQWLDCFSLYWTLLMSRPDSLNWLKLFGFTGVISLTWVSSVCMYLPAVIHCDNFRSSHAQCVTLLLLIRYTVKLLLKFFILFRWRQIRRYEPFVGKKKRVDLQVIRVNKNHGKWHGECRTSDTGETADRPADDDTKQQERPADRLHAVTRGPGCGQECLQRVPDTISLK